MCCRISEKSNIMKQPSKPPPLPEEGRSKQYLLIAMFSAVPVAFSAGSAILDPSPISLLACALFTVASTLNWIQFSKRDVRRP